MMLEYERVSERLLRGQPKPKKFGKLVDGKWLTGTKSLHRTPQSRRWRMFWRLKSQRVISPEFYWKTKNCG